MSGIHEIGSEVRGMSAVLDAQADQQPDVNPQLVTVAHQALSGVEHAPTSLNTDPVDPWTGFLRSLPELRLQGLAMGGSAYVTDEDTEEDSDDDGDYASLRIGSANIVASTMWKPLLEESDSGMDSENSGPLTAVGGGDGLPPFGPTVDMDYLSNTYTNLTRLADSGDFDDVIGRDQEARQILQALIGGFQPRHVILFGAEGIGKRRLLKRVAHLMTHQSLPPQLAGKQLIQLDVEQLLEKSNWKELFDQFLSDCSQMKEEVIAVVPNLSKIKEQGWQGMNAYRKLALHMDDGLQVLATAEAEVSSSNLKPTEQKMTQIEVTEFTRDDMIAYIQQRYSGRERVLQVTVQKEAVAEAFAAAERKLGKSQRREIFELACDMLELAIGDARLKSASVTDPDSNPQPLFPMVTADIVKQIEKTFYGKKGGVTSDTAITARMDTSDPLTIGERLKTRVFGQEEAVDAVSNAIIVANSGLHDPEEPGPIGSFLFLGPTGVGKTELAKSLSKELNLPLRSFDMTEYQAEHTVSRLFGAPPGYVGYDEGGQLTEFLKKNPKAVILLDEIEKAHRDVLLAFMPVFDEGRMTDGQGTTVDCSQAVFIMTSNLMATEITRRFNSGATTEEVNEEMMPVLKQYLRPELLNRLTDFVTFKPLSEEIFRELIPAKLHNRFAPIKEFNDIDVKWGNDVFEYLCDFGYDAELGLRPLKRLVEKELIKPMSIAVLKGEIQRGDTVELYVIGEGSDRKIGVRVAE